MTLDLMKLAPSESSRVKAALKDGKSPLSAIIPDDIEPRELLVFIKDCVVMQGTLVKASNQVGALIGRGLALMKARPEVLGASGYDTLKAYEEAEIVGKLASHGSIWQHKRVIEMYPELSTDEIKDIGIVKLTDTVKNLPANPSPEQKRTFLDKARESPTVEANLEWIEQQSGHGAPGSARFAKLELMGPGDQIQEIREFLAERDFIEWAETDAAAGMILAAIKESTTQWQKDEPRMVVTEEEAEDDIPATDAAEDWGL